MRERGPAPSVREDRLQLAEHRRPISRRSLVAWGPATGWAAVLFLLSEIHGVPLIARLATNDKAVHIALYAVMGALLAWGAWYSGTRLPHLVVAVFGFLYGAIDEVHQFWVPNRFPSVADFAADVVGVILGYLVVLVIVVRVRPRRRPGDGE